MKYALAFVAAIVFAAAAVAEQQHGHAEKGPNGGPMEDVAGVHAELMVSGNAITLNIFDENNKPVATKGFTGSALVVRGKERETVRLESNGASALRGAAKMPVAGAAVTVTLRTATGKSGQARYKP